MAIWESESIFYIDEDGTPHFLVEVSSWTEDS